MAHETLVEGKLPQLLLVDDDLPTLESLAAVLGAVAEVDTCTTAEAALLRFERYPYDIVVADYGLPNMDGEALLKAIGRRDAHVAALLITGSQDYFSITKKSGYHVLLKPVDPAKICATVRQLGSIVRMKRTVNKIRESFA